MADTPTMIAGERQESFGERVWFEVTHDFLYGAFTGVGAKNADNYHKHTEFLRGMGASDDEIRRFDSAYIIAQSTHDGSTVEALMSQYTAGKTADQLLDGFERADPSRHDLFEILRTDETLYDGKTLKESLRLSIEQDPSVFYAFSGITGKDSGIDRAALVAELADPTKRAAFADVLKQIGESPELTGASLLSSLQASDIKISTNPTIVADSQLKFLASLTGTTLVPNPLGGSVPWFPGEEFNSVANAADEATRNAALMGLIEKKGPAALLGALEAGSPASKPMIDIIRGDTELANALHKAVISDPTVLTGLSTLIGPGSSLDANGLANALADEQTRKGVITMLEKTGDPNLDLDFADLSEAIESGVAFSQTPNDPKAIERYKEALAKFKLQDNRIALAGIMADPQAALMNMLQDPHKFFADIRAALGNIPEGSFLDGALDMVENGIASYSEDPNIATFMEHYDLQGAFKQVTDLQGRMGITELDAPVDVAPTADVEVPAGAAPVGDTAALDKPEVIEDEGTVRQVAAVDPRVVEFNAGLSHDAAIGVSVQQVASLDAPLNGNSIIAGAYNKRAFGFVPADEIEKFGNDMLNGQANRNTLNFDAA